MSLGSDSPGRSVRATVEVVFEAAELGRKLSKAEYAERVPELRIELLAAQRELEKADFGMVVLLDGVGGAGKSEVTNLLHEWMDARFLTAHAFGPPTEEERARPEGWRRWMSLPPAGRTSIYVGSWYGHPIVRRALDETDDDALDADMRRIANFERMLADDGTLVLKFWLHVSEKRQARRMAKLEKDPNNAWRVTKYERRMLRKYQDLRHSAERALRLTSTGQNPWVVVEAGNARHRNVTVGQVILDRLRARLARRRLPEPPSTVITNGSPSPLTVLDRIDLSPRPRRADYERALARRQGRLARLALRAQQAGLSSTVVLEGWDAAGKGGCIRRIIPPLDARFFRVIPVSAPTDEERAHHYLWRFWRHLPRPGHMTIYDRSWYGRVLVERVEGLATHDQWRRAYKEINDFEEQLIDHGTVLLKFWLHISQDEQLRRFEERQRVPWKQHKITDEDWRNRDKAPQYMDAVGEMVERTSTEYAPWNLVSAESKLHARLEVLRMLCQALQHAL